MSGNIGNLMGLTSGIVSICSVLSTDDSKIQIVVWAIWYISVKTKLTIKIKSRYSYVNNIASYCYITEASEFEYIFESNNE